MRAQIIYQLITETDTTLLRQQAHLKTLKEDWSKGVSSVIKAFLMEEGWALDRLKWEAVLGKKASVGDGAKSAARHKAKGVVTGNR